MQRFHYFEWSDEVMKTTSNWIPICLSYSTAVATLQLYVNGENVLQVFDNKTMIRVPNSLEMGKTYHQCDKRYDELPCFTIPFNYHLSYMMLRGHSSNM